MHRTIKRLSIWALVVALILLIPVVGQWPWTLSDYVFAGILLFGVGVAYEFITRRATTTQYRIAVGLGVVTTLLLIWINGAVGIIGNEDNPANLLYGAVLIVGFLGTIISQLRPRGMSYTLFTAASVQLLVPVAAFLIWRPDFGPGVLQVFAINAVFAVLWLGSGLLFRQAAQQVATE